MIDQSVGKLNMFCGVANFIYCNLQFHKLFIEPTTYPVARCFVSLFFLLKYTSLRSNAVLTLQFQ